ncbi:hypothetical protein [Streptomyces sp. NPDC058621]|uniref:hypothetical protein n=1 Tax=Streptomyces sp. NPDC058621 TaxID=3346561 RepID=UPI003660E060
MSANDLTLVALKYAGLNDTTERVRELLQAEPDLTGAEVLERMDAWVQEAYGAVKENATA